MRLVSLAALPVLSSHLAYAPLVTCYSIYVNDYGDFLVMVSKYVLYCQ